MLRLPASLQKQLTDLFPNTRERERFVAETLRAALEECGKERTSLPSTVGGTLHLFTDGGSRGNPGEAAIGCILQDPVSGKTLQEYKEAIGSHTNNVAEYKALIAGLEIALRFHPNHLLCYLDSELIVKQLSGEYRVKMPSLQPLLEEVQELSSHFHDVSFAHIPRGKNRRADQLVNEALDSIS